VREREVDAVKHETKNDNSVKVAAEIPGLFSVSLELHRKLPFEYSKTNILFINSNRAE